ncbi:MAG: alanine--tRNA ligase, partial [Bacteroidales bacterium]|nr:alanine--tRNA ligase [Bacteroidales bacterium]
EVGDTGTLTSEYETIPIINTVKDNNLVIHITEQLPQNPEVTFMAAVNTERRQRIANNHSATHWMHAALRKVLGSHVEQKGSLVDDQRLRFDFSHFSKMTPEEIRQVEKIVNQKIRENIPNVTYAEIPIDEAKAMGATALFGEKYGDKVRVVVFDKDYSMELCGGCHTSATGNIGMFKIVSEGAIAAGIRRIEAITGEAVEQYLDEQLDLIGQLRETVKSNDLVKGVVSLNEQNSALRKEVERLMQEKAQATAESLMAKAVDHEGCKLIVERLSATGDQLRNIALILKQLNENTIAILGSVCDSKPALCLLLPVAYAENKGLDATKLIREVAKEIQGGGGGQPSLCVAGGRNADGLPKAMEMLKERV